MPIFLIASAVRALLGTHLAMHGSFTGQPARATALAPAAGNLPAAAAMLPAGTRNAVGSDPGHDHRTGSLHHRLGRDT